MKTIIYESPNYGSFSNLVTFRSLLDPVLPYYVFAFAIALWLVEKSNTVALAGVLYFGGNKIATYFIKGTAVVQWLRCCATNRKVVGSIPDGVTGNFH